MKNGRKIEKRHRTQNAVKSPAPTSFK